MRRSVRRVLGMGVVLGTMGLAFSGSALGAVVGTSPIPTYQANGRVYVITVATGTLLPWNPNVSGTVRAIDVVGSTAYLGGSFTSVGGTGRRNLAAVDAGS